MYLSSLPLSLQPRLFLSSLTFLYTSVLYELIGTCFARVCAHTHTFVLKIHSNSSPSLTTPSDEKRRQPSSPFPCPRRCFRPALVLTCATRRSKYLGAMSAMSSYSYMLSLLSSLTESSGASSAAASSPSYTGFNSCDFSFFTSGGTKESNGKSIIQDENCKAAVIRNV